MITATSLLSLALGWTSASGCGSSKPLDEPKRWELTFDESNAPVGAHVMLGDHWVGSVSAPLSYETDRKLHYVRGTVPASFTGSDYTGFEIELRTPCGTQRVPLSTVKADGRADPLLHFDPSQAENSATTTVVWTAMGTTPKVQLGETELSFDMDHHIVQGMDCAPKHTVTLDGELMGELEVTPSSLVGIFIPKDTSTCYQLTVANYGEMGGSTETTFWRGKAAYPFPHDRVDHLLEPVPTLLRVTEGTADTERIGVMEISCDEAPADAPSAG